ncbi:MAG: PilT/PilU family type 4a pilus ATPase [Armatimonadetes bacterium]|nr:PilT/PilU family type 4a pilus ATPase [Armatimonadota bacterium]NIO74852.1 PilT/PilU family type 4a pilus ATPase [Armatimonadota bacterium]NIO95614.1 PilT/PilU family type 4a pilus ATPase [Armatimonadota bacterium]
MTETLKKPPTVQEEDSSAEEEQQSTCQTVDLSSCPVDLATVTLIPRRMATDLSVLALWRAGQRIAVAMADPRDIDAIAAIKTQTGFEPEPLLASEREIQSAVDRFYTLLEEEESGSRQADEAKEILHVDELLAALMEKDGSDLHLSVGSPPVLRVNGELIPLNFEVLTPARAQEITYAILTDERIAEFEQAHELDFAYSVPGLSRFRVNLHFQRGSIGAAFRTVPMEPPSLDELGMPSVLKTLCYKPRGLVLVTGPTGSGKSTTLAAMVKEINMSRRCHIITIEDPIEFLHRNNLSIVIQREVGSDTHSFANALRHILRQDPDVILVGEMRDLETIASAITAAETGHLVFATLHTTGAAQSVDRMIDVFPPHQQTQIRLQLSAVLEGIICQTLLPRLDSKGRVCAQELLIATSAVRNLIREGKSHQLASVQQAGAQFGMQTLDQALKNLVVKGMVAAEVAAACSSDPEDFLNLLHMK